MSGAVLRFPSRRLAAVEKAPAPLGVGARILFADFGPTWNWYSRLEIVDQGTCRITSHWRVHRRDHRTIDVAFRSECFGEFAFHEDQHRIVRAVSINTGAGFRRLSVENPKHVFSYIDEGAP